MRKIFVALSAVCFAGCAHQNLAAADLDRVSRPAFVSWIVDEAGPKSSVFREDSAFTSKLSRVEPREADRRLQAKLKSAISRFEVSDRLRATTLASLPRESPWTRAVDPAAVASALESYLVEEVPANPPDFELLKPLGADAVVELVVENFGLHSANGRAGAYIEGRGRMFLMNGRTLWRRSFRSDQLTGPGPGLDPFEIAKEPELFRSQLASLLDSVAAQFAHDLTPPGRK